MRVVVPRGAVIKAEQSRSSVPIPPAVCAATQAVRNEPTPPSRPTSSETRRPAEPNEPTVRGRPCPSPTDAPPDAGIRKYQTNPPLSALPRPAQPFSQPPIMPSEANLRPRHQRHRLNRSTAKRCNQLRRSQVAQIFFAHAHNNLPPQRRQSTRENLNPMLLSSQGR